MARGWESKAVEEQISLKESITTEFRKGPSAEDWERTRKRKVLSLSRTKIEHELQRAQNPRYIEMLKKSLADIDRQMAAL